MISLSNNHQSETPLCVLYLEAIVLPEIIDETFGLLPFTKDAPELTVSGLHSRSSELIVCSLRFTGVKLAILYDLVVVITSTSFTIKKLQMIEVTNSRAIVEAKMQ